MNLDFREEDTIDVTGEFFSILEISTVQEKYKPRVPPHLSEESVALWDEGPLY